MSFNFFKRLFAAGVGSVLLLVPGMLGLFLWASAYKGTIRPWFEPLGLFLFAASVLWFVLRAPAFFQDALPTARLNQSFMERLAILQPRFSMQPFRIYFRRPLYLVSSPLLIGPVISLLIPGSSFETSSFLRFVVIGFFLDLLLYRSSVLSWYVQRGEKLQRFFLVLPLGSFDVTTSRAYIWHSRKGRGTSAFDTLAVVDAQLKPLMTLPVVSHGFEPLRTEILSQCLQVPVSLRI